MRILASLTLGLLGLQPLPAATESLGPDRVREIEEQIRRSDGARELVVSPLGRLRISHPQKVSAAIGAIFSKLPVDFECTATCDFHGLILQAEPGLTGGQLSAGFAKLVAGRQHREQFLSQVYMGWGVKGALLRTWGDANLDPPNQTFVGIEGAVTVINVNFSLGAFRHVGSGEPDEEWRVAGGIGWGF